MTQILPLKALDDTPWLAQGVLDLRARFRKIIDLVEYIDRPFLVDMVGTALWYMTQVDGCLSAWTSVISILRTWRLFCEFVDADVKAGWQEPQTIHDLTSHHFVRFAAFLVSRYPSQSTRSACFYHLTGCLQVLQANRSSIFAANFVVPVFPERQISVPGARRTPYTDAQMFEIVRICRREIAAVIHRLRIGRKLVVMGQDPSGYKRNAWRSQANVLWYVRHVLHGAPFLSSCVDKSAHPSLSSALHKHRAGYPSMDGTYAYLYPHIEDLTPFVILLHALLDENHQCIMDLRLGDIEPTENTRVCRIRFVKTRPARKEFTKLYGNTSIWSPGRIIHMIKLVTASLRQWTSDPELIDRLWVYLARRGEPVRAISEGEATRMVSEFGKRHGLPDLQLSRFRVTNLSRAYRLTGNLALIKDRARHAQMQTTVHYLTNPGTRDLHHASIETAQNEALTLLAGTVVASRNDESEAALIADHLRVGAEAATRIATGEQDVFIASCRDFYNRPDGPPNTPCDRPFACFTCRNAVWTSSILPRLIRFREFLEEQRAYLSSDEWQIRFGFPYRVITEAILPAFKPEIVSLAEAAATLESLYVPAAMRGN
ncbi:MULTISPECIES: site-specific integrase [Burkholderiaceae]|uniref:Site-specific integrase n=1 Tax=Paraburkholderia phytofirmans (strain DSM 17436 / LMG 22146 / PsJN) TaxID=398527 RepID=B2THA1_PARPJ|nr:MULTISPECIES: site-specific integrase [Burkholderiaceae]ACD21650.1 hypothetical protein Bphyt_7365 [Paraburkholderia phytofirmans PsJN]